MVLTARHARAKLALRRQEIDVVASVSGVQVLNKKVLGGN